MKRFLGRIRQAVTLLAALAAVYLALAGYLHVAFQGWEQTLYAALGLVVVLPAWRAAWKTLGAAKDEIRQS